MFMLFISIIINNITSIIVVTVITTINITVPEYLASAEAPRTAGRAVLAAGRPRVPRRRERRRQAVNWALTLTCTSPVPGGFVSGGEDEHVVGQAAHPGGVVHAPPTPRVHLGTHRGTLPRTREGAGRASGVRAGRALNVLIGAWGRTRNARVPGASNVFLHSTVRCEGTAAMHRDTTRQEGIIRNRTEPNRTEPNRQLPLVLSVSVVLGGSAVNVNVAFLLEPASMFGRPLNHVVAICRVGVRSREHYTMSCYNIAYDGVYNHIYTQYIYIYMYILYTCIYIYRERER